MFGLHALKALEKQELTVKKALIVTSEKTALERYGDLNKVTKVLESMDIKYIIFDEIEPIIYSDTLNKGASIARDFSCDFIVGLGSQKAIDSAKLIATLVHQDDQAIKEIFKQGKIQKSLPSALDVLAIPTNYNLAASLNDEVHLYRQMHSDIAILKHPALSPKLTIIDSSFIENINESRTLFESLDTMTKALSLLIHQDHPIYQLYAQEAIDHLVEGLSQINKDASDIEAKEALQYASLLMGLASDGLKDIPILTIQNTFLSLNPNLPQGILFKAFLIPYLTMIKNKQIALSTLGKLNKLFEVDVMGYSLKEQAEIFIQNLEDFLERTITAETNFRKYDIDPTHISDYTHHLFSIYKDFTFFSEDELYNLLEQALVN